MNAGGAGRHTRSFYVNQENWRKISFIIHSFNILMVNSRESKTEPIGENDLKNSQTNTTFAHCTIIFPINVRDHCSKISNNLPSWLKPPPIPKHYPFTGVNRRLIPRGYRVTSILMLSAKIFHKCTYAHVRGLPLFPESTHVLRTEL